MLFRRCLPLFSFLYGSQIAWAATTVTIPTAPSTKHVVDSNFLGPSFELSYLNEYFGNDTSSIPPQIISYLTAIKSRISQGLRVRVGGNSADDPGTIYDPQQTSPILSLTSTGANANYQPATYGPGLFDVMAKVSDQVGGIKYLIGISLNDSSRSDAPISADATRILGGALDAIMIGNEPDLYTPHGVRPQANYTAQDYIGEFTVITDILKNTSAGNLVTGPSVAGPTLCCFWDAGTLLEGGYLAAFKDVLKYMTLQRYPQNNCFGSHAYNIPYYVNHLNVIELASWQSFGVNVANAAGIPVIMSEFNSASCGGVKGVSDTFAVGSLWTVDYALQLASVSFSAAYVHTRESGVSYNLLTPGPNEWTTDPPFYALLATPEILGSDGVKVVDMNVSGSNGGYAIFDATNIVTQIALFNFANSSTEFTIPAQGASAAKSVVKFLSAASATEQSRIAWGGETYQNGEPIPAPADSSWAQPNLDLDCSKDCTFSAPGPSLAVVFLNGLPTKNATSNVNNSTSQDSSTIRQGVSTFYLLLAIITFSILL